MFKTRPNIHGQITEPCLACGSDFGSHEWAILDSLVFICTATALAILLVGRDRDGPLFTQGNRLCSAQETINRIRSRNFSWSSDSLGGYHTRESHQRQRMSVLECRFQNLVQAEEGQATIWSNRATRQHRNHRAIVNLDPTSATKLAI